MIVHPSTRLSLALVLTCALNFGGCAVTGQKELQLLDPEPVTEPSARVWIWRIKQFCGSTPLNYVAVDGRPIAALATGQHTAFDISPGRHTLDIIHHTIDSFLAVGGAYGAIPYGVNYSRYGISITEDFLAEKNYWLLLRSKCFSWTLDENKRVEVEKLESWPEDIAQDSKFVRPGKDGAK